jgi:FhuF 2Fe-2S C-terminal domain/Ferric iron reductase FhuF-like transporter
MRAGEPVGGTGAGPSEVPGDVPALLAAVAGIGPFFAVAVGPEPAGGGWVPVRDLWRGPGPGDPLGARIAAVRAALRTDLRVAASTAFHGVAAQIVAPLFATVVLEGALPAAEPDAGRAAGTSPGSGTPGAKFARTGGGGAGSVGDGRPRAWGASAEPPAVLAAGLARTLHWRPGGAGPWLWWPGTGGRVVARPEAVGDVLVGLLAPLVVAVRARVAVAERVLWGNAASAVASARGQVAVARPEAAERAAAVAERLLTAPPLAATAVLGPPEPPDLRWTFRRRSCCLYYRVPGGGVCGDCVLRVRRPGPG